MEQNTFTVTLDFTAEKCRMLFYFVKRRRSALILADLPLEFLSLE